MPLVASAGHHEVREWNKLNVRASCTVSTAMPTLSSKTLVTVEAELTTKLAHAQLLQVEHDEPVDRVVVDADVYRLDMSLTPRPNNASLCYPQRWSPTRFEPVGNMFVLPPGQSMHARSDRGRHRSVVCRLPVDSQCELLPPLEWSDHVLTASLDIVDSTLRNLLKNLAHEVRFPGFASEVMVELLASQIAIQLTRYYRRVEMTQGGNGLAPWRLRLIEERVRQVRAAPSLTELASLCRLSVRQLSRGFRQSRGCSLGEHVAGVRLDHAKHMLLRDNCVKTVAHTLGFASPSAFCFAFRRATGQSPLEYRETARVG
jgi:AraC family transcriptional regulator